MADDYDAMMAEAITFAESCSEADWQTPCSQEQRTVGVLFDHIAVGNPQVVRWIQEFLADRPIPITPEILDGRNAKHSHEAANRPRQETISDLKHGAAGTSRAIRALTDDEVHKTQEFGWAGTQEVGWVASAAFRHPRGHLKSIRQGLGR
ncbi:MAG: maleylpyruvate isomerase N-terminal domain-containing protein [Candidatus Dormiibacterota bacterium]